MSSTFFLRRVSLQGLRKSLSSTRGDQPQPVVDQAPEQLPIIPDTQTVLLLHGARQPYEITDDYPVPVLRNAREILVRTQAIGLNPIDWKAPDFNFAIPKLPYISGRELAGEVVNPGQSQLKIGDRVLVISTDYRDLRKAAYQQYVVALDYNTVRLPPTLSPEEGSTLGVAFVAAALALGVCMGLNFSSILDGPDLYTLIRQLPPNSLAADIRDECLSNIQEQDRAQPGDWIAVWGGSSTSANLTLQLAHLAGLRTIAVADTAKHGVRLSNHRHIRPDLLVDSHDPARAVDIIQTNVKERVRFGIDTRGRDSAGWLARALAPGDAVSGEESHGKGERERERGREEGAPPSPPATPHDSISVSGSDSGSPTTRLSAHLIGLTGLPKQAAPTGMVFHTVPIKLFHEVPAVGQALVEWMERLLQQGLVAPPEIIDVERGLGSVNRGLDRMRKGEISGGKLVVRVE